MLINLNLYSGLHTRILYRFKEFKGLYYMLGAKYMRDVKFL